MASAAAAAAATSHCDICARDLSDMLERGKDIHRGKCLARKIRREAEQQPTVAHVSAGAALDPIPMDFEDGALQLAAEVDDEEQQQFSKGDQALLTLFYSRSDIKVSLLEDIIAIARMPDRVSLFTSARQFLDFVDRLPGPEFARSRLTMPGIDWDLSLWTRNLVDVAMTLVQRFNGAFADPAVVTDPAQGTSDFVDGQRYRKLCDTLRGLAGADAVLIPLVFSSGW